MALTLLNPSSVMSLPPSPHNLESFQDLVFRTLKDQQDLTAVERFTLIHENQPSSLSKRYSTLLPVTIPAKGEQYAFEVDLDRCSSCKACVTACHNLNGLTDNESWRRVGTLVGGSPLKPELRTVTTACHHCVDPGCLNGCPVGAYEKDTATGIVRHLDDQCIGCQYCSMTCPYDVPVYLPSLGIVRKCDMCYQRITGAEAPACVQACPNEAIAIRVVTKAQVTERAAEGTFLSDTPDPRHTKPTTVYKTQLDTAGFRAADHFKPILQPAHWPLILMLLLTQGSAGLWIAMGIVTFTATGPTFIATLLASLTFTAGLMASFFHLGRPMKAWRFFLGLKTSWLSREILAFNACLPLLMGCLISWKFMPALVPTLHFIMSGTMLIAVVCSIFVYSATGRNSWRFSRTAGKFFGSVALACLSCLLLTGDPFMRAVGWVGFIVVLLARGLQELAFSTIDKPGTSDEDAHAVFSENTYYPMLARARRAGYLFLPVLLIYAGSLHKLYLSAGLIALVALVELTDRFLFFRTVAPNRMPGVR